MSERNPRSPLARQRAWNREHCPCAIKGCKYVAHTGNLCRKHYGMVPRELKIACMAEVMTVSHNAAKKHHRQQLAFVRRQLAALEH